MLIGYNALTSYVDNGKSETQLGREISNTLKKEKEQVGTLKVKYKNNSGKVDTIKFKEIYGINSDCNSTSIWNKKMGVCFNRNTDKENHGKISRINEFKVSEIFNKDYLEEVQKKRNSKRII